MFLFELFFPETPGVTDIAKPFVIREKIKKQMFKHFFSTMDGCV